MPLPYWVQMAAGFSPFTCSGNLVSGLAVMGVAAANLGAALPVWWPLALAGNLVLSVVVVIAMSYLVSSLAFYAPVQCEEISNSLRWGMGRVTPFPLSGMPARIKYPLLTIFPAGLVAWLPTLLILGRAQAGSSLYAIAFAAFISLVAAHFFRKGFKYYVRTGINRYHAGGHRS